jgi:hypothetical protein
VKFESEKKLFFFFVEEIVFFVWKKGLEETKLVDLSALNYPFPGVKEAQDTDIIFSAPGVEEAKIKYSKDKNRYLTLAQCSWTLFLLELLGREYNKTLLCLLPHTLPYHYD